MIQQVTPQKEEGTTRRKLWKTQKRNHPKKVKIILDSCRQSFSFHSFIKSTPSNLRPLSIRETCKKFFLSLLSPTFFPTKHQRVWHKALHFKCVYLIFSIAFYSFTFSLRAPNYNQKKISFAQKVKVKQYFISENKLRNEDKKTIREIFERKHFSHRTVLLEFSTKTKATLTFLPSKAWLAERFSRKMNFQEGKVWEREKTFFIHLFLSRFFVRITRTHSQHQQFRNDDDETYLSMRTKSTFPPFKQ